MTRLRDRGRGRKRGEQGRGAGDRLVRERLKRNPIQHEDVDSIDPGIGREGL